MGGSCLFVVPELYSGAKADMPVCAIQADDRLLSVAVIGGSD